MKLPLVIFLTLMIAFSSANAQRKASTAAQPKSKTAAAKPKEFGQIGIVIDEGLSVLRKQPSLFADIIRRLGRGRKLQIIGSIENDGVKFFKVVSQTGDMGWIQSDAVFGKFRDGDDTRLANLARAVDGFDQIEMMVDFFDVFPDSKWTPSVMLLLGDVIEEAAVKLSKEARSQLKSGEMSASAAPVHSYFLNFVRLDRYRKLGIVFNFNPNTRLYHYNGEKWRELIKRFPASPEAAEAEKRIRSLQEKLARKSEVRSH